MSDEQDKFLRISIEDDAVLDLRANERSSIEAMLHPKCGLEFGVERVAVTHTCA